MNKNSPRLRKADFTSFHEPMDADSRMGYMIGGLALGMVLQNVVALLIMSGVHSQQQVYKAINYELLAYFIPIALAVGMRCIARTNCFPWLNNLWFLTFNLIVISGACLASLAILITTPLSGI